MIKNAAATMYSGRLKFEGCLISYIPKPGILWYNTKNSTSIGGDDL